MGVRYYKLFDLLNRKGMKKTDLREILSAATVAKLSKGEYISGEAIEKICRFLQCQPGDIMEIVDEDNIFTTGIKKQIKTMKQYKASTKDVSLKETIKQTKQYIKESEENAKKDYWPDDK